MEEKKEKNLLDEFFEIVSSYTDAPEVFINAIAYWLASATMGKFVTLLQSKRKYPRPNIFVLLSSVPAITRRSTLVTIAEDTYRHVLNEINEGNIEDERLKPYSERLDEDSTREEAAKEKTEDSYYRAIHCGRDRRRDRSLKIGCLRNYNRRVRVNHAKGQG